MDIEEVPVMDRAVWAEGLWAPVVPIMVTDICRHHLITAAWLHIAGLIEAVDAADV